MRRLLNSPCQLLPLLVFLGFWQLGRAEQKRVLLDNYAELLDDGRDADHLAFRRDERAYRNLLLVEQPNGDYAVTILKQFLYDAWHLPVLEGLSQSTDERIAGIAAKAVKEVTYHLRRSSEWVERLGGGDLHVTMPYSMIEPVREMLDAAFLGWAATWNSPQRDDDSTPWSEAVRRHGPQTPLVRPAHCGGVAGISRCLWPDRR